MNPAQRSAWQFEAINHIFLALAKSAELRVKDLYDLARIIRAKPISETQFWTVAGREFRLACESRYVDCFGLDSFKEGWTETRALFEASGIILKDCTFEDAEATILAIVEFWRKASLIPFSFPLPQSCRGRVPW